MTAEYTFAKTDLINNHLYVRNDVKPPNQSWSRDEFKEQINSLAYRYHIHHPLDKFIMDGNATKELLQSWVANRYYYQSLIPMKDSAVLSNCPERDVRNAWFSNIVLQDKEGGGLDDWQTLARRLDIEEHDLKSFKHVLPGVKFACDKYLDFVKSHDYKLGIAACLTITYASDIHKARLLNWPQHYTWLDNEAYNYFRTRQQNAKHEKDVALEYVLEWFKTPEEQALVLNTIKMKQDILWSILDNIYLFHFTNIYDGLER